MADEDLATRAPENDAQEDLRKYSTTDTNTTTSTSVFPNDTPAQSGPSMGEHCTTDRPQPTNAQKPSGELTTLNSITCYISKPADYPHNSGKLLLLLTGGTGIHSVNNQLQADAYAARGFLVVMPDQFGGDDAPKAANTVAPLSPVEGSGEGMSIIERIKVGVAEAAKSWSIDMWLAKHTPERVLPILQKALEGAREAYGDALANGGGIYGAGYCFGAKYILLLSGRLPDTVAWGQKAVGTDEEAGVVIKGPELRAGVIAHGTMVTKEDVGCVRIPMLMICVKNDPLFPDDVREQGKTAWELSGIEHDVKVFSDVPHGFAVVGDYEDNAIKTKQQEAFEMMHEWLERH